MTNSAPWLRTGSPINWCNAGAGKAVRSSYRCRHVCTADEDDFIDNYYYCWQAENRIGAAKAGSCALAKYLAAAQATSYGSLADFHSYWSP